MKRVLFISPLPPPYYGSAMSSEMCLEILKKDKSFQVKNIKINYSKELSDVGKINLEKLKGFFKVKKEIKKEIKEFSPDLIYIVPATSGFGLIRDSAIVNYCKNLCDKKIILHLRSRILKQDWESWYKKKLLKKMLKKTKVIVLGETLIQDLNNSVLKKDVFVLPNAIENEVLEKDFRKIKKEQKLNLLFLSNMDEEKGWKKVLDACLELERGKIKFKCNFVGSWIKKEDEEYFNKFVLKNKLEKKVFYLGRKVGEEKNKILEKTDILIFPTEYKLETFGRVILEGAMFGVPTIANPIATIPDIIEDEKTGVLLKKNTGEEIAKEVLKIRSKSKEMGVFARERFLRNYELKEYSRKFTSIFN
jgi:glycosyltransferase involved in cell wall biosynthesis